MEHEEEGRGHNDVLFVSTTTHLDAPFLAGMARVRASRAGAQPGTGGAPVQADDTEVQEDGGDEDALRWVLDTRYYTAELQLVRVRHTEDAAANVEASVQAKLPRGACDAFLLLCDAAEAGTSAKLQRWQAMLEELAPAVQLCVAHAGPNQEQHQANVRAIEEWCNENAVELVLWNPLDEGSGVGEASPGGLLSERHGLDRVLEALEANMWPAMTMKPRTGFLRPISLPDEESVHESEGDDDEEAGEKETVVPSETQQQQQQLETKQKGEEEMMKKKVNERKEAPGGPEPTNKEDAEEEWTDDVEEHFDKAFKQLAGLREARQQSAQMSDQQRRDFAADAALALARAFGLDLENDSSDSD